MWVFGVRICKRMHVWYMSECGVNVSLSVRVLCVLYSV